MNSISHKLNLFEEIALKEFLFLEEEYGFRATITRTKFQDFAEIHYQSEKVFLRLFYCPQRMELDFVFGRLGIEDQDTARSLWSGDLLFQDGTEKWSDYQGYHAYEIDNLHACVPKLARFLKECGRDCLIGDDDTFESIGSRREEESNRLNQQEERDRRVHQALLAWQEHDYKKVIEVYSSMGTDLTRVERKRLVYAKNQVR